MILNYELKCRSCPYTEIVKLDAFKFNEWKEGALIQNCFPELSKDQREILISKTCIKCFDKLHGEPTLEIE